MELLAKEFLNGIEFFFRTQGQRKPSDIKNIQTYYCIQEFTFLWRGFWLNMRLVRDSKKKEYSNFGLKNKIFCL